MRALILVLLFALAATVLAARTVPIPGENFTIDLPDDWTTDSRTGMALFAHGPDAGVLQVQKLPNPDATGINAGFVGDLKNEMAVEAKKLGATLTMTGERSLTLGGVPAYLVRSDMMLAGQTARMQSYVIATRDAVYLLALQTPDAAHDAELESIANSVHFTTAPALPDSHANDFAAGERGGRFAVFGLAIVAGIAVVGIALRKSRRG
jgi:hypothetical protein